MTKKTNQSEKYMKNVCAVSNFIQVLLMRGYGFNEFSLPSISFQEKVRSEQGGVNICEHFCSLFIGVSVCVVKLLAPVNDSVSCTEIRLVCGGCSQPPLVFLQVGGTSVGWALGYMLSLSNMVPAESFGLMKALPSGPWAGILFLFITLLLIAVGYLLIIYRNTRTGGGMV